MRGLSTNRRGALAYDCLVAALATVGVIATAGRTYAQSFPFADNLRATVDIASRIGVSGTGARTYENAIGLDLHSVLSGEHGDWGTLLIQGYFTGINNHPAPPPVFDDGDDTAFIYRILNFNLTRFGRGRFNVRFGHFEIPFGLEQVINTNGTIRDFMHGHNLGLKADWGAGVNGILPGFEYEVTVSRGTGSGLSSIGDPYVLAGRLGTPQAADVVLGASVFHGRVWNPMVADRWAARLDAHPAFRGDWAPIRDDVLATGVIERRRYGGDVQWYMGPVSVLGETAFGTDSGRGGVGRTRVLNSFVEVNREAIDGRLHMYTQSRLFAEEVSDAWRRDVHGALGARFSLDRHWVVSAEYAFDITARDDVRRALWRSQVRYRF